MYRRIARKLLLFMAMLVAGWLYHSCNLNNEWDDYYNNPPDRNSDNLLTLIGNDENYSLFYDALIEYGFGDLLLKNQYFTVFVPTNAAFDALPDYSQDEWEKILGFHIIYKNLYSRDFDSLDLLTYVGKYLNMRKTSDNQYRIFEASVNINSVDHYCQNGVVHEIDRLLIPRPNVYEYIMALDTSYSILQDFLNSMDARFVDYEKSERIGVNDNGDPIYDTVWRTENYFLDNIAGLNSESEAYTAFIPSNIHVREALNDLSGYFGDISQMEAETYKQLLFITFSGSFLKDAYAFNDLPDTIISVTGKSLPKTVLRADPANLEMSNGMVHILSQMTILKNFFLLPVVIECNEKQNRRVSNTIYAVEELSDSRATNGSYVMYGCQFVGDYLEFTVNMVLKTTYWITWTGPKQGPSHYQVFVKDETTGEFVNVGDPVNNWTKPAWKPVVSGTYTFNEFGTKTIRFVIVDEKPMIGLNSIYVDYIKLTPDEIYVP